MKKLFYIFAVIIFALTSCVKYEDINPQVVTVPFDKNTDSEMIKLGKKRENPYSLENVQKLIKSYKPMVRCVLQ